jgi:hypothetical protein
LSLLVVTDTRMRMRGRRHAGPRAWGIVAALGLAAQPVMAQETVTVPGGLRVRRVVLARSQAGHPAPTIYGAAGQPLLLKFDAPLGKGPVRAPGMEIRRPSSPPNALFITPSKALSSRSPVPVVVPLLGGSVTFMLALKPEAPDGRVDILRLREPALVAQAENERSHLPETLRNRICALAAQPIKVIISNAAWPDATVKYRVSLLVQTPDAPEGIPMELRSAVPTLCEPTGSTSTRADGGR